jgi:hypothetical protein
MIAIRNLLILLCIILLFLFLCTSEQKNQLDIANVNLGKIKPGSKIDFSILINNKGKSNIPLSNIITSCGCVSVNQKNIILFPGENKLDFTYSAGDSIGDIEQEISFFTEKGKPSFWNVKMSANIDANIWAEPSHMRIGLDETERLVQQYFTIYFPNNRIQSFSCDVPWLFCENKTTGVEQKTFTVSCNDTIRKDVIKNVEFCK